MNVIGYPFRTLKEARDMAVKGSRWLAARGCNQILGVNRKTKTVEVPLMVAVTWPGICDLMTGS